MHKYIAYFLSVLTMISGILLSSLVLAQTDQASNVLLTSADTSFYSPIPIKNCDELMNIMNDNLSADYVLTEHISCKNLGPYDAIPGVFTGTLTSQDCDLTRGSCASSFTIRDLEIDAGLFSEIEGATIAHVNFQNIKISTKEGGDRGLIAPSALDSTLKNILVDSLSVLNEGDGRIENANSATGGLIGVGENVTVFNVHLGNKEAENIKIQKDNYAGGLIGMAKGQTSITHSSVQSLYSFESINCHAEYHPGGNCGFGGLIGVVMENGSDKGHAIIDRSSAKGEINTKYNAGGLIGLVQREPSVIIKDSYSFVALKCDSKCKYAGGLIGRADEEDGNTDGLIKLGSVYAAGKINASNAGGAMGVVGYIREENDEGSARVYILENGQESLFDHSTKKNYSGDHVSSDISSDNMKKSSSYDRDYWHDDVWNFGGGERPTLKPFKE